jgi:hypothetical protein
MGSEQASERSLCVFLKWYGHWYGRTGYTLCFPKDGVI